MNRDWCCEWQSNARLLSNKEGSHLECDKPLHIFGSLLFFAGINWLVAIFICLPTVNNKQTKIDTRGGGQNDNFHCYTHLELQ